MFTDHAYVSQTERKCLLYCNQKSAVNQSIRSIHFLKFLS